jgi:hypothetical protein
MTWKVSRVAESAALVVFHRWLWWISAKATALVDIQVRAGRGCDTLQRFCLKLRRRNNAEIAQKNGKLPTGSPE